MVATMMTFPVRIRFLSLVRTILYTVVVVGALAGEAVAQDAPVTYREGQSLRVIGSDVLMRAEPFRGADVVQTLSLYDHVEFLGDYTVEPITVTLRGEDVSAPYLRVRADSGQEGWIFGGLLEEEVRESLLQRAAGMVTSGDTRADVRSLYGADYLSHETGMPSPYTQALLDRLGADEAWEYYYFRTGEGIAFGFDGDTVISVRIRQDVLDNGLNTYWRTVDGYLDHPLRRECHETPGSATCDAYRR